MIPSQTQKALDKQTGDLIHAWRNEIKHTLAIVAHDTGIPVERLKEIEKGYVKPERDRTRW